VKEFGGLERNRYFQGKLLTASDFATEQEYCKQKRMRHNRYLHGWGVVYGFVVWIRGRKLIVDPGIAIDCAGNELVLDSQAEFDTPNDVNESFVVVEYFEKAISPVTIVLGAESSDSEKQEYSRIQEGCRIGFMDVDPVSDHNALGPGTPGCGHKHPISIARVCKGERDWEIILCGRLLQPNNSLERTGDSSADARAV
jgi:hypothetical protein